ncbi:serine hydrolase domain-containing protein [Mycolicibacterium sp.]|uniref:serine hydrolase domain-containing protein n=1 Tax=Mycolicibacterium sp. TaxID=2320850 RepID=UPI003D13192E
MRSIRALLVATTTALLLVAPPAAADPATDLAARLDRAIEARVAQMGIPGAIVSLSIPGTIDYVRAVGVGDTATGIPMRPDFHHRIGSVTKTFTGTAILQLVDRGMIRLSDPISHYVDGVPAGDRITLDMLGRMRSGLPDFTEFDAFIDRLYQESPSSPTAFAATPRKLVDWAFTRPSNFEPDTQWEYSNTNTVLLGLVVERVTGMPFAEYLQQNIFGPLGLTQTSYPADGWLPGPYAHGYNQGPDGTVYDTALWNPSWADAAGEIVSTAADQRAWAAALGIGSLLRPDTQAQRVRDGSVIVDGVRYAFAIFDVNGWLGHNGDIPGYATVTVYLPELDATLVVLANSDIPEAHSAGQIAHDVTSIATPGHVYELGPEPPLLLED